jgi:flagellar hook protein FlgE
MLRSMFSGIAGMKNFQTKLDVIGNNISNVNTFGYKKGRVIFKDLMSQNISGASTPTETRGGTNPIQIGLGSTMASIDTVATQGSLQTTGRQLDLSINGDGYFAVKKGDGDLYTRAGNFYLDQKGTLVTADGFKVQGYAIRPDGSVDLLKMDEIKIDTNTFMPPSATTYTNFVGNIDAKLVKATPTVITTGATLPLAIDTKSEVAEDFKIKDSLGFDHDLKVVFTRTESSPNPETFSYKIYRIDYSTNPAKVVGDVTENGGTGKIVFTQKGEVDYSSGSGTDILGLSFNPGNGAEELKVIGVKNPNSPIKGFDVSRMSMVRGATSISLGDKDGNSEGYIDSFNISATGEVVGLFTNGKVKLLSQLGIATFANNGGLLKMGNNYYSESNNSGFAKIDVPGVGRGSIQAATLEMSNVDLAEEFTEMITAQRGFQANTKIISTSDEILQELNNLKR